MERSAAGLSLVPAFALLVTGCDAINARRTAQEGVAAYKKGDFEAAAESFTAALAVDPTIIAAQLDLGFACLQLFKIGEKKTADKNAKCAIEAFSAYRKLRPEDPRGKDYLLQSFVDTLHYDEALAYLKPELEATPPSTEAMAILGQISAKLGRVDQAMEWCTKRRDAAPTDPAAHACLGTLVWDHLHKHLELTGEDRLKMADQGIESLMKAIELAPDVPDRYIFANLLYRERALAHCVVKPPDPSEPLPSPTMLPRGKKPPPGPTPEEIEAERQKACEEARAKDIAEANRLAKLGLEKSKARAAAVPPVPGAPGAPPAPPAPPAPGAVPAPPAPPAPPGGI